MEIIKGKTPGPPKILLYGTEGIGKSSFGAQTPNPVFIQTEDGLDEIDCERYPLATSFYAVMDQLTDLSRADHPYETVVIDTADWLEKLIWDHVCRMRGKESIEEIGYAKGYVFSLVQFREILSILDMLRNTKGMMIVILAHAKIEKVDDPFAPSYDRYSPRLNKHASALITEWCSEVLFAGYRYRIETEDKGFNKERTIAVPIGNDRILKCVGGPACVGKNRHSLPAELPFPEGKAWAVLAEAMFGAKQQEVK